MKKNKILATFFGVIAVSSNTYAKNYSCSPFLNFANFTNKRFSQSQSITSYSETINCSLVSKIINSIIVKEFQDEKDDMDFIEFDSDTITVPVEHFRQHTPNDWSCPEDE